MAASTGASALVTSLFSAAASAAITKATTPKVKPPPMILPPGLQQTQLPGQEAANRIQQRAKSAFGAGATNFTGPSGLTDPATTANKSLLGN